MIAREEDIIQAVTNHMRSIGEVGDIRVHMLSKALSEAVAAMVEHHTRIYDAAAAKYDQAAAHYDQAAAKYEQVAAKYDQAAANYDQAAAKYEQAAANYEHVAAKSDQAAAKYDQAAAHYDQVAAKYDHAAVDHIHAAINYVHAVVNYNQAAATRRWASANCEEASANCKNASAICEETSANRKNASAICEAAAAIRKQAAANCEEAAASCKVSIAKAKKICEEFQNKVEQYQRDNKKLIGIERFYGVQRREKYQVAIFAVLRHLVNILQVKLGGKKYKPYESIIVLKARLVEIMTSEVALLEEYENVQPGFTDFVNMTKLQPFLDAVIDEPTLLAPEPHCSARMLCRDLLTNMQPESSPTKYCDKEMAKYALAVLLATIGPDEATNALRWVAADRLSVHSLTLEMLSGMERLHPFVPTAGIKDQSKGHKCLDNDSDASGYETSLDDDDTENDEPYVDDGGEDVGDVKSEGGNDDEDGGAVKDAGDDDGDEAKEVASPDALKI